jgi:hypothetical protein
MLLAFGNEWQSARFAVCANTLGFGVLGLFDNRLGSLRGENRLRNVTMTVIFKFDQNKVR